MNFLTEKLAGRNEIDLVKMGVFPEDIKYPINEAGEKILINCQEGVEDYLSFEEKALKNLDILTRDPYHEVVKSYYGNGEKRISLFDSEAEKMKTSSQINKRVKSRGNSK